MSFPPKIRYLLVNLAVLIACVLELARGIRPIIVLLAVITFVFVGNLTVYLSGTKERAIRRRQKRDYWAS